MQTSNLQFAPGGVKPVVNVSQFDVGRQFSLKLYDGATAYIPPVGTTIRIDGVKPDGHGFSYTENVSLSGSVVTVTTTTQMTIVEGTVNCELRMSLGDDDIGTVNFDMIVERSPINEDTDLSETEVPALVTLARAQMENAEAWAIGTKDGVPVPSTEPQYHNSAKYWAESVGGLTQDSEAWAVGTKDGTPVTSSDPQYHNNSKWYAEAASDSATAAAASATGVETYALKSEGYAIGKQNGTPVSSGSPYYHNNAEYYAGEASSSATAAGNAANRAEAAVVQEPYIGANGNWFVYDFQTSQYVDTNVDATGPAGQDGQDGATGATGNGIVSISKTGTSGLVDTYTILYTNGNTDTFTVTNGQNGTGSGDMMASAYDPTSAVYNAGGIPAYITSVLNSFGVSDLDDVAISSLANGNILIYNSTSQKWENGQIAYSNISGTPTLATVATSGAYSDLSGTPTLATVATSGAYSDLSGTPTLATVATSGAYSDLSGTPSLGTAAAKDYTTSVTSASTDLVTSGAVYSEITTLTNTLATKQNTSDNSLTTTDKTIVGAINEVDSDVSTLSTSVGNKHKVTSFEVTTSSWTQVTTGIVGTEFLPIIAPTNIPVSRYV